jgi:hypothetical protein
MKERYADDVQSLDVDAIIRELVVATENWILDHNKGAGDVKRAFEERLEELGLAHLRHGPGCRRAEPGGACAVSSCRWVPGRAAREGAPAPVDLGAARQAWEHFEAGCAGLVASKCSHHRPYMGCPLDCGDVDNAIGEEWAAFRPLVGPLIDEIAALRGHVAAPEAGGDAT